MPNKVKTLRYVGEAAPNFEETCNFYQDAWGLKKVDGENGIAFFAAEGSPEQYIFRLRKAPEKRVDVIGFGVDNAADVDAMAKQLADGGVRFVSEPGTLNTPGGGYGFRFFDPEGRTLEISSDVAERAFRELEQFESIPRRLSHVVLGAQKHAESIAFYRDMLGFTISDWIDEKMCFMRCHTDEHTVAIFPSEDPQLNHVAFEYRGIDEFMRATGRVLGGGHVMRWGPGRHVVGDNTFSYFFDPNGNVSEITTDMEQCYEDWKVRHMIHEEAGDQWGTAKTIEDDKVPPSALIKETGYFVAPPV